MANNYSLLRIYNIKKAKLGDEIRVEGTWDKYKVVYVSTERVLFEKEDLSVMLYRVNKNVTILREEPLLWVEDRPVYSGDRLYYLHSDSNYSVHYVDGVFNGCTRQNFHRDDSIKGFLPEETILVWTKPITKVKKRGWINVYAQPKRDRDLGDCYGIYSTKEDADENGFSDRTDCIQIEWEEEEKE